MRIAERRDLAVLNQEGRKRHRTALPFDGAAFAGFDRMARQDRRIVAALGRDEAIGEPRHDVFGGRLVEIDRNAPALMQHDRTQIVDAVGLVGMLMGQEHRIDVIDIGVDQLLAQVGRGIDHDPRGAVRARALDQQRAAAAAVFGLLGSQAPQPSAGRGTPAEEPQPRIVSVSVMPPPSAPALWRTAGRSFPWSAAKSPPARRRASPPALLRLRPRRTARCACREICRAPDRARRFRP